MLAYETEIFTQVLEGNVLVVLGKHLGMHRIVRQLVKLYSDPHSLVLVINSTPEERQAYLEDLALAGGVKLMPRIITNEVDQKERSELYMGGGVLFVTSRILVVDMLTKRVPTDLIAGIIVTNAHKVTDTSSEAFIMRLYREDNKEGFIKAFSENVEAFTKGFAHAQRLMRNLYVSKLLIWPRFHASVSHCFSQHSPEVLEDRIRLTDRMLDIQRAIIDIMDSCLKELKRANPSIQIADLTLENGLFASFDFVVRQQLNPIWHKTGPKTRQLVADLRILNNLLIYLSEYDCVAFYDYLETIRTTHLSYNPSAWVFMDAATMLFEKAKERVFVQKSLAIQQTSGKGKKRKIQKEAFEKEDLGENMDEEAEEESAPNNDANDIQMVLEENPKWEALARVLQEIEDDILTASQDGDSNDDPILVLVSEERTVGQLREYLCSGGRALLLRQYNKHLARNNSLKRLRANVLEPAAEAAVEKEEVERAGGQPAWRAQKPNAAPRTASGQQANRRGRGRRRHGDTLRSLDSDDPQAQQRSLPVSDTPELDDFAESVALEEKGIGVNDLTANFGLLEPPVVAIHSMRSAEGVWHMERLLREVNPRYVILYDPDLAAIRQLEVFKAERPGIPLRVYFLCYDASVEEQKFLTSLRREKEAFEHLIHEKSIMALPNANDVRVHPGRGPSDDVSSRRAGRAKEQVQKVVVDMREFRSNLPSLLHQRGMQIVPVTLEVGDYILSPEICVERKSISDLISSLSSGRLFNQCEAMQRHYKLPMLLIEFDENKSFSLHSKSDFVGPIQWSHICSKLTLLSIHFPGLRILWCQNPYATAEVLEALKTPFAQPDENVAASIGADSSIASEGSYYNRFAQSLLLRMPGINSSNVKFLMNRVESLYELSTLSLDRLKDLLGPHNGLKLYEFLNADGQQGRVEDSQ